MKIPFILGFLGFFATQGTCQVTTTQQKALNNYVKYANESAEDVTFVFNKVLSYYPRLALAKKNYQRLFLHLS